MKHTEMRTIVCDFVTSLLSTYSLLYGGNVIRWFQILPQKMYLYTTSKRRIAVSKNELSKLILRTKYSELLKNWKSFLIERSRLRSSKGTRY